MMAKTNNISGLFFPNIERSICSAIIFLLVFSTPTILFAQVQTGSFVYEGNERSYVVFLPQEYGATEMPVVINLHGDTQSGQSHLDYTLMNMVADTAGFIVVYPNAFYDNAAGYKSFNRDDITALPIPTEPDTRDVGFIDVLIDTLNSYYLIDLDRIYACGFSGGGTMAFKLGCQLSDRITAVASVSGEFSKATADGCAPSRAMPVLSIHGTADPIVPYDGADGWLSAKKTVSHWANLNICLESDTTLLPNLDPNDGSTVKKITYPNCTDSSSVIFYIIRDGFHAWPGAAWTVRNMDINASLEMWNFFKAYRLSQFSDFITMYPGDTDNNGVVDALDVLPVGVYFKQIGSPRINNDVSWGALSAVEWSNPAATYADANGDGVVDEKDVIGIGVNWGNTHDGVLASYTINPTNIELLGKHLEAFDHIYHSLSGDGEAVSAIKSLLRSILDIQVPEVFALHQNYPNPFNPRTTIQFGLPEAQLVTLSVYNLLGQVVTVLVDNELFDAGYHKVDLDASRLSSGLYFYRIKAGNWSATRKIVVLK